MVWHFCICFAVVDLVRKDWPHNSGDDIAGVVHSVGSKVFEFKPGDRVAALHEYFAENGSFAEYASAPDWTTIHLPDHVSFEEGATLPCAAMTAAMALYDDMRLCPPYDTIQKKEPLLIYGITSAVGAFAAKLARLSGYSPIIGIAGRSGEFAKSLADVVVDYRPGEDKVVAEIEKALIKHGFGGKVPYVFDAISENGTLEATLRFVDPAGVISTTLPPKTFALSSDFSYPAGIRAHFTSCFLIHTTRKDFGHVWSRYLGRLLQDGRLDGHPYEVVPGGLSGVLTGLQNLKNQKASGFKYVYRIGETTDIE